MEIQNTNSNDSITKSKKQKLFIKHSLSFFLLLFIIIIILMMGLIIISENMQINKYREDEQFIVNRLSLKTSNEIQQISIDLSLLTHRREMTDLWDTEGIPIPEILTELTAEYLTATAYWGLYDQIRLIDETGMEIIRINYNNGLPVVISQEELQNKKERYYFDDALKLDKGGVYVSPLDLNIEYGKIELPIKPMIRFATPVFDQLGNKRGIILLNYFGSGLIKHFSDSVEHPENSNKMLLNTDGYWLTGPNPDNDWGFMYEDRKNRTFANSYREEWDKINAEETGQFKTTKGLFTFNTVYPLLEGQTSSSGSGEAFSHSKMKLEGREYYWKVVSFISVDILYASRNNRIISIILITILLSSVLFFGILRITKESIIRKHTESMLQDSEKKIRAVLNATTDEFMLTDPTGIIVELNSNAANALDHTPEQLIGKSIFGFLSSEINEKRLEFYKKIIMNKKLLQFEDENQGRYYDNSIYPILDDNGNLQLLALFAHDISERKRIQHEQLKYEKLKSIGILAGGIAHDFNNLLTSLFANIEMAMLSVDPGHEAYKYLRSSGNSMERAVNLTKQLLTFAKGGDPIKKILSIGDVIIETANFSIHGSNVKLIFNIDPNLRHIKADKGQLSQVISNLVINAQQSMPDGGKITIVAGNIEKSNNPYIQISIHDDGVGIQAEHLDKIFDPYYSTKQKGSGLGLASTYSIINKHNGTITVDSQLDKGTFFIIRLPAVEKTEMTISAESDNKKSTPPVFSTRILVMEDEEIVRDVIEKMLVRIGYTRISFTVNGNEAVTEYKTAFNKGTTYDIVITDLTVPGGMGGETAAKEILKIDPDAKIIVSSGYSTNSVLANHREYGFKGIALKPYRIAELQKVIEQVLKT